MKKVIKVDLDDMLFSKKNKDYGAYHLRTSYKRYLFTAMVIGMGAFALAIYGPSLSEYFGKGEIVEDNTKSQRVVELSLENLPPPPPPDDEPLPPPPPKVDIPPPKLRTVAFRIPEPKPKDELVEEEEVATIQELEEAPNIGLEDVEGADEGFIDIPEEGDGDAVVAAVIEEPDPEPKMDDFIFASQEPEPINMDDVRELIGYPDVAREANIEGKVLVRILVDKEGNYSKHKVIKKAHPVLAEAVEDHIKKLRFTPALQGSKPIKFWVNVPFSFQLLK